MVDAVDSKSISFLEYRFKSDNGYCDIFVLFVGGWLSGLKRCFAKAFTVLVAWVRIPFLLLLFFSFFILVVF